MSAMLNQKLEKVGRSLRRWRALERLCWGGAALFVALWLLGLFDMAWPLNGAGRWATALLLWALIGVTAFQAAWAFHTRFTPEGLATLVERAFPSLDNHLINYIQFSQNAEGNPFKQAYVQSGPPPLDTLDVTKLKNRRAQRRSRGAILIATGLLLLPTVFWGTHWPTAIWRVANPLSAAEPVTLTRILEVAPGDLTVPQGDVATLRVTVRGASGHTVRVDVDADDARRTTYEIGRLQGDGQETFSHRVPRANTRFRYRFRAGDAPASDWFTITPLPPPAFTALRWEVEPPAYTRREPQRLDVLDAATPEIPDGSRVRIEAASLGPLERVTLSTPGSEPVAMEPIDETARRWRGTVTITDSGAVQLDAVDAFDQAVRESVAYHLIPDRPPVIEVLSPEGRARLPTGEAPRIAFHVRDDYGLKEVYIEQVADDQAPDEPGERVQSWAMERERSKDAVWRGEPGHAGRMRAYRIVAVDNAPDEPQVTRTPPIVFNPPAEVAEHPVDTQSRREDEARNTLQQVIEQQRANLESSRALREQTDVDAAWGHNAERQQEIRRLTRDLLRNPARPLGGRAEDVARLYANEMVLAVDALTRVAETPTPASSAVREAVSVQERILRRLEVADMTASESRQDRQLDGLAKMLEAMVREQTRIVDRTGEHQARNSQPDGLLVEAQEDVAEELVAFKRAGSREADGVSDSAYAELLAEVVQEARNRRIREDMFLNADRLESAALDEALTLGRRAQGHLEHLQAMLDQVRVQREEDRHAAQREALTSVQTTTERLMDMHADIKETMDAIRGARDAGEGLENDLLEDFAEIARRNRDSLLTIPVDLHVFSDLNVGNEFVEEVFSIYEEIEQQEGSENWGAEEAVEWLFTKNEEFIAALEVVEDQVEMIEKWLPDAPKNVATLTETIDREEMPEDGITLETLNAEVESLISDLLDMSEELEEEARNAATTMAAMWNEHDHFEDDGELPEHDHLEPTGPDEEDEVFEAVPAEIGHETAEGEYSSFAGLGDAGNERPDHMEQDGRSTIGREGMAVGETSASSGTIQEGDENIQERRTEDPTQDGMVQADGEAQTAATGGGKLGSGAADDLGMTGGVRRMDSTEAGSAEGMQALLARHADDIYAQASMQNVRVGSLRLAAHHIRQIDDAIARGDIQQLHEHQQAAVAELRRARAQLAAGTAGAIDVDAIPQVLQDAMQAGTDLAPSTFRAQVAEYYKMLNETF